LEKIKLRESIKKQKEASQGSVVPERKGTGVRRMETITGGPIELGGMGRRKLGDYAYGPTKESQCSLRN